MDFITSGGFLGNIVRGLGQRFGLGKTYNQPTYDMRGIVGSVNPNNLDIYNEFLNEEDEENNFNRMFDINTIANLIDKNRGRRLEGLNTFRNPPGKEITDYQKFLQSSPSFVSFDEYQQNVAQAPKGIMQSSSLQDLEEIGKGVDYIGYDPDETAAIAAGTKIPQLGDLTSFIDIDALRAARERETNNIFNK